MLCVSVSDVAGSGVRGEVTRLSRGSAMLSAHSHATHEMASVLHEFARRIRARADVFRYAASAACSSLLPASQALYIHVYIVCETSLISLHTWEHPDACSLLLVCVHVYALIHV